MSLELLDDYAEAALASNEALAARSEYPSQDQEETCLEDKDPPNESMIPLSEEKHAAHPIARRLRDSANQMKQSLGVDGQVSFASEAMTLAMESNYGSVGDAIDEFRKHFQQTAFSEGHYGGLPIPSAVAPFSTHPRHPMKDSIDGMQIVNGNLCLPKEFDIDKQSIRIRSSFWSSTYETKVFIYHHKNTPDKLLFYIDLESSDIMKRYELLRDTEAVSEEVWSIEAEEKAESLLKTLITPKQFKSYRLVGTFIETSKKSGCTYMFRKARPTLAFGTPRNDSRKLLCALCLHQGGYYINTFAGTMCPTDDIIAHLLMMRADEHRFWKKANHHDIHCYTAGF